MASSRSLGSLTLDLVAKIGGFKSGMDQAERIASTTTKRMQAEMARTAKQLKVAFAAFGGIAATGLGIYIKNTIEAEKSQAQLAARIKDTAGAAGRSLQQLNAQAEKLQNLTIFDDESIADAQAALLTFTNVTGETFDRTIEAATDLATVMGTDVPSAAKLLGKALSDPTAGMGALRKAGITLTEDQKALIKAFQKSGDVAGAQDVILDQLAHTMGSAAEASRDTLGGALEALKNSFNNMLEGDGGSDGARGAKKAVEELAKTMNSADVRDGFDTIVSGLADITSYMLSAIGTAGKFRQAVGDAFADANKMSYEGLITHQQQLKEDLAAVEKGSLSALKQLYFGRDAGEVGKVNISQLESLSENAKRLHAELDQVNERAERMRALMVGGGSGGIPSPGGSAPAREVGVLSEMVIRPPKGGGGADKAARDRQAEVERQKREMEDMKKAVDAFHASLADMRAEIAGPLEQALLEHNRRLEEINKLADAGKVGADERNAAIAAETTLYEKKVDAIKAQKSPLEEVIDAQKRELALMGLTGAQLQTQIDLYGKSAEEVAKYGSTVARNNELIAATQETIEASNQFKSHWEDAFASLFDGTKNFKEAFTDLANSVIADIARMASQKLVEQLFANFASGFNFSGAAGSATANGVSSANGNVFENGSVVPFANGGVVMRDPSWFPMRDGRIGTIAERNQPEAIMPLERKDGVLGVRGGGGVTVNQTFITRGRMDARTVDQQQKRAAEEQRLSLARNA